MQVVHKRKERKFLQAISRIISQEVTNHDLAFITISEVKLSKDNLYLDVYYSNIDQDEEKIKKALALASNFIKMRLAQDLNPRIVPNLRFKVDKSFNHGQKIEKILKSIHKK